LFLKVGLEKQNDASAVIPDFWECLYGCGNSMISFSVLQAHTLRGEGEGAAITVYGYCYDLRFQLFTKLPHPLMRRPAHC